MNMKIPWGLSSGIKMEGFLRFLVNEDTMETSMEDYY